MYAWSTGYAFAGAALAAALLSGPARAAPPTSLVGTWNGFSNQTALQLVITSQGTGPCRTVQGTMGSNPVSGFYCPRTGRLNLLRKLSPSNDTVQVYSGNVGDEAATGRMSGTFAAHPNGGTLGEYPFWFTR
jgi:hypothetical protein